MLQLKGGAVRRNHQVLTGPDRIALPEFVADP